MVHFRIFTPTDKPETAVVGSLALVNIPEPETTVHNPVPIDGVLADKVETVAQMDWSEPAFAVVGAASIVILTSSNTLPQAPPGIVQRNTLIPVESPLTPVVASEALTNVPLPLMTVQIPPVAAVAAKLVDAIHNC